MLAHAHAVFLFAIDFIGGVFGDALQVLLGVGGWRFYGPVFVGDRVAVECTVLDVSAAKDSSAGAVELEFRALAADGSLAQRGTASVLVARAPSASPA